MRIIRQQIPVGQGCFHMGEIYVGASEDGDSYPFRYLYDCGSASLHRIRAEVGAITNFVDRIDALFISHLDSDHVNGLDCLLSRINVDTVYIPYVDKTVSILDHLEAERDGSLSASLIEATLEPHTWFGTRGVRRVVRIVNDSRPPPADPVIPPVVVTPDDLPPDSGDLGFKEFPNPPRRLRRGVEGEQSELLEMLPGDSVVLHIGGQILDWFLLPYTHPVLEERRASFNRNFRQALRLRPRQSITSRVLLDGLRDSNSRTAIRDCYEEIVKNGAQRMHNRVSMSLYSGPTGRGDNSQWRHEVSAGGFRRWYGHYLNDSAAGWIGTGDATLKVKKVREEWMKFYHHLDDQIITLLLPHHGSKDNFHAELLELPHINYCVTAARGSKHHPSDYVRSQILNHPNRDLCFWNVSSRQDSRLIEEIYTA